MRSTFALPVLHIQLLGDFRLLYGEDPVTSVNTPRLQSLLAYLLLHRHAPQPRLHLAFLFWPDSTESHARGSLRKLVHQLGAALPDVASFLQVDSNSLQWRLDAPFTLDASDFEKAAGDPTNTDAMRTAVDCYRGDLLPSCYDDWIIPERERLRQVFINSLESFIRDLERRRDYAMAISYAQRLLQHEPLHEETCRDLMRLYALSGDRGGALRTYHACATALERELGIEPSHLAREEYERLLSVDAMSLSPGAAATTLVATWPLVGREQEWASLVAAWRAAAAGKPHFVLLSGTAGIGKSRLMEELLGWARRQGIATASLRSYPAEGVLAYAPITAWLRGWPLQTLSPHWRTEIARLLPELLVDDPGLAPPPPLTREWQRQHLFEAITRALLAGPQPLLLAIDDLQWCDRETLEWLHYLLRYDTDAWLFVLGTVRLEEMAANEALTTSLLALRREEQLTEIELGPLTGPESAALAEHITRRPLAPAAVERLVQETEGNSLFVVEMSRAAFLEPVESEGEGERMRLPPTIQAVIGARLEQLSPSARELATTAATIGREFTLQVLQEVSGENEDVLVRDLDELWQKRIVREQASGGYDFSHDKLRQVAYGRLGTARRQLLHRRIALALAVLHADNIDAVSGEIAAHYERANSPQPAIPYFRKAAETALRSYANRDAIALYKRGIALLEHLPRGNIGGTNDLEGEAVLLYEGLGDVLELVSQHEQARETYRQALKRVVSASLSETAHLHRMIGNTYKSQGRYDEALAEYDLADGELKKTLDERTAAPWREWIQLQFDRFALYYGQADVDRMAELTAQVRPYVEAYGTPSQRAHLYRLFIQTNFRRDRYLVSDATLAYVRAAFAADQESGDANHLEDARFDLGFASLWQGELAEAEANLKLALAHNDRIGNLYDLTLDLTYLTVVYRKMHQDDPVRRYATRALEAASEASMPGYIATAKGNLAWLAWRAGDHAEAQAQARAALEMWPAVYPFQWIALMPLIDIALKRNRASEAVQYARKLLHPLQQALPEALAATLENAIGLWQQGDAKTASKELARAMKVSHDLGYI